MKTQTRFTVILATTVAMVLAYLGGTFVSAQTHPLPTRPRAPALTQAQWAALAAANSLLLDGEGDATTYLPLILRR